MSYEHDRTVSTELIPMLDKHSGRVIMSSIVHLEMAMSRIQSMIAREESVPLNYFYDHVGIDTTVVGEQLGWPLTAWPEIRCGAKLLPNNTSIVTFWYSQDPIML